MRYIKNPENLRYSLNIIMPLMVFLSSILSAVISFRAHELDVRHFFMWVIGVSLFTSFCSFFVVLAMTGPIKDLIRKVETAIRFEEAGKSKGQMMEVYKIIEKLMELAKIDGKAEETKDKDLKKEFERLDYIVPLGYMSLMVAHEVRNPLNTITGMSELLKSKIKGEKESLYLDNILNSARKIDDFTKEILDFTDDSMEETEFDINSIIRDSIETLRFEFRGVNWEFDEKTPIIYRGDKNKIYQALFNIIKNAFEYERDNGIVKISIDIKNNVDISVFNRHSRLVKGEEENIFKPFFTKKRGGRGIGLFIAMRNIKLHRGDIKVKTGDEGTTFIVQLPSDKIKD
ncbi:MAG TPA: HAMP domain-containing sensor histidine kinase [Syntrophorhabdaceae bacterium]|nr:HAMP domain-containing sensor histidine kinase [Syntrophorhabdaceae bacterium]